MLLQVPAAHDNQQPAAPDAVSPGMREADKSAVSDSPAVAHVAERTAVAYVADSRTAVECGGTERTAFGHVTERRANEESSRSLESLSTLDLERSCSKLSALQVKPTGSLAGGWI